MGTTNDNTIVTIKAVMSYDGTIRGKPYRTIALEGSSSLHELATAVVESFGFELDHCFGYYDNIRYPFKSHIGYEEFADLGEESEFPGVAESTVAEAFPQKSYRLLLLFDYGDDWRFILRCTAIEPAAEGVTYPELIDSAGEAPEQYPIYDDDDSE